MRLEGEHRRRLAEAVGAIERRRDHGLVAAMHAVEIAHGEDGAAERAIGRMHRARRGSVSAPSACNG